MWALREGKLQSGKSSTAVRGREGYESGSDLPSGNLGWSDDSDLAPAGKGRGVEGAEGGGERGWEEEEGGGRWGGAGEGESEGEDQGKEVGL